MKKTGKPWHVVLNVDKSASIEEIKKAYRKRCIESHPDLANPDNKTQAEDDMKNINEAYESAKQHMKDMAEDHRQKLEQERIRQAKMKQQEEEARQEEVRQERIKQAQQSRQRRQDEERERNKQAKLVEEAIKERDRLKQAQKEWNERQQQAIKQAKARSWWLRIAVFASVSIAVFYTGIALNKQPQTPPQQATYEATDFGNDLGPGVKIMQTQEPDAIEETTTLPSGQTTNIQKETTILTDAPPIQVVQKEVSSEELITEKLKSHLNKNVAIIHTNGESKRGVLASFNEKHIVFDHIRKNGHIKYQIPWHRISKIEFL